MGLPHHVSNCASFVNHEILSEEMYNVLGRSFFVLERLIYIPFDTLRRIYDTHLDTNQLNINRNHLTRICND